MGRLPSLAALRMRALTFFYRRATLMERTLDDLNDVAGPGEHRAALLTANDVAGYLTFRPQSNRQDIESRLARGHEAFLVSAGGRIVHAAWTATGRAHVAYLHCDLLLGPDEVLVYDSYTNPAFRGKRFAQSRMAVMFDSFRERGYRRCLAIVAVENVTGRHAMESGGYRPIGRITCIRLGSWSTFRGIAFNGQRLPPMARVTRA